METFTVKLGSVYFTVIQAIKAEPHKYSVLGEALKSLKTTQFSCLKTFTSSVNGHAAGS